MSEIQSNPAQCSSRMNGHRWRPRWSPPGHEVGIGARCGGKAAAEEKSMEVLKAKKWLPQLEVNNARVTLAAKQAALAGGECKTD